MADKHQFVTEDSVRLSEIRQHLVEYWRTGSGRCMSCPMSCTQLLNENLQSEDGSQVRIDGDEMPDFGAVNPNAPIMMVNNTPNYNGEDEYRPYTPTEEEYGSNPINQIPLFWSDSHLRRSEHDDDPRDRYTYNLTEEYTAREPIEKLAQRGGNDGITWRSFYYTNSLKCTEFNRDSLDSKARKSCVDWLEWEIADVVDPSVIITGGPDATASALAALEHKHEFLEGTSKDNSEITRKGRTYTGQRPRLYIRKSINRQLDRNNHLHHPYVHAQEQDVYIIPIPQFSIAGGNGSQAMSNSDYAFDIKYYDFLYETVTELL